MYTFTQIFLILTYRRSPIIGKWLKKRKRETQFRSICTLMYQVALLFNPPPPPPPPILPPPYD